MELGGKSDGKPYVVNKQVFQLKTSRKDGLILQVHHTVPSTNGEIHRVRFVLISFDNSGDGERVAAADYRGNIFIIDLTSNKFWLLPNLGSCSLIGFSPYNAYDIVVGTNSCTLHFINTELGTVTGELTGHTVPPTQISFSSRDQYCLTASTEEGIIWDLKSNSQAHRLTMRTDVAVKRVVFMPVSNNILACFQDDTMHVWKFETFECLKQIVPEAWKSHHVKTIAFTRDGRAMVIGGHTPSLVVFALDNWSVKKVIELQKGMSGVRHMEFLPQLFDGGANKILGMLSSKSAVHFLDIETSLFLTTVIASDSTITRFTCSSNGKYIACILHSGEVNIYSSETLIVTRRPPESPSLCVDKADTTADHEACEKRDASQPHQTRKQRHTSQEHLTFINKQIKETLDLTRLKPILKEFGEYPESYRSLIWKTILQLPHNQSAYIGLVNRDCHPTYLHLEENYPLENKTLLKNLKRLLSCLAHWSPLFGEVKYLPLFVFPFVKVFQNDPFVCFEAVITIIVNWCQHWFEYFPFPPVNVLAIVENVLSEHDPELVECFYAAGVTSQVYAWPLLENALSEVLAPAEWLRLWDHVLSNGPAFLLMAVVAYNAVSRAALKSCRSLQDFEFFYHNQNAIDMKKLLSKTYHLCKKTSSDIHPRQYLKSFQSLEKGAYPAFNLYPKFIVDNHAEQVATIQRDEEEILKEHLQSIDQKIAQEKLIQEETLAGIQEGRLQKLEEAYHDTIEKEEERVSQQRQKVLSFRQELRSREVALLEVAKNRLMRQHTQQRTVALDRLLHDIKRKQTRDDGNLAATEDELRQHYAELLTHKLELEQHIGPPPDTLLLGPSFEHRALQSQQEQLAQELSRLRNEAASDHHSRQITIATRISKVDEMMQRVEMELAREMAERQCNLQSGQNNLKTIQLESKTRELETEVAHLLEQLTEIRLLESKAKMEELAHSQADRWKMNEQQQDFISAQTNSQKSRRLWSGHYPLSGNVQRSSCSSHGELRDNRKDGPCELTDQWTVRHGDSEARQRIKREADEVLLRGVRCDRQQDDLEARSSSRTFCSGGAQSGISLRSSEYYAQERNAVHAAMRTREQLCNGVNGANTMFARQK